MVFEAGGEVSGGKQPTAKKGDVKPGKKLARPGLVPSSRGRPGGYFIPSYSQPTGSERKRDDSRFVFGSAT